MDQCRLTRVVGALLLALMLALLAHGAALASWTLPEQGPTIPLPTTVATSDTATPSPTPTTEPGWRASLSLPIVARLAR